jgi:hypothetical protein
MTKNLMALTPNQLHNELTRQGGAPAHIEAIKQTVLRAKRLQRIEKITTAHHAKAWHHLLSPLKYELANARVGLQHKGKNLEHRIRAFTAYIALMEKALSLFAQYQELTYEVHTRNGQVKTKRHTPSTLADSKAVPNNGTHWTDWIPQTRKQTIIDLFNEIPHTPKTKRKIPFQRMQRPNTKQREALLNRTIKEMGNAETEQRISPTPEREALIAQMQTAIRIIKAMKPSEAVPYTWHALKEFGSQ